MATEDILVWDGTEFVSIQGKPGQSPIVDPNCDVSKQHVTATLPLPLQSPTKTLTATPQQTKLRSLY